MNTNEWGQLKKVIVGVADNAKVPEIDISLRCVNYADKNDETEIITGPYPQRVIDEANQDLDVFCKFLQDESIEVLRPDRPDCKYYNYCPRDSVFIHGELTMATPMPIRARRGEWRAFEQGHYQYLNNMKDKNQVRMGKGEIWGRAGEGSCRATPCGGRRAEPREGIEK